MKKFYTYLQLGIWLLIALAMPQIGSTQSCTVTPIDIREKTDWTTNCARTVEECDFTNGPLCNNTGSSNWLLLDQKNYCIPKPACNAVGFDKILVTQGLEGTWTVKNIGSGTQNTRVRLEGCIKTWVNNILFTPLTPNVFTGLISLAPGQEQSGTFVPQTSTVEFGGNYTDLFAATCSGNVCFEGLADGFTSLTISSGNLQAITSVTGSLKACVTYRSFDWNVTGTEAACETSSDGKVFVNFTPAPGTVASDYEIRVGNGGAWTVSQAAVSGANTISGLPAGSYTVAVVYKPLANSVIPSNDATCGYCKASVTIASATATLSCSSDPDCPGGSADGSVTVAVGGNPGTVTYNWGGGNTNATLSNLLPGNYTVTVTYGPNGKCSKTTTCTVVAAPGVDFTVTPTNVVCNGANNGTIVVDSTSGTANYTISVTGQTNKPSNGAAVTYNNLAPGDYTITVTDANGCSTQKMVTITQPNPVSITCASVNTSCKGLSDGKIRVTGVTSDVGGPYKVSVDQIAGGNNDIAESVQSIPYEATVGTGTYVITVKDKNDCIARCTTIVKDGFTPAINCVVTQIACFGGKGTITATASGKDADGNPVVSTFDYVLSGSASASNNTGIFTGLSAGTYTVTATKTGNVGCSVACTGNIIVEPAQLSCTITGNSTVCPNAKISFSGPAGMTNYVWTVVGATFTGQGTSSIEVTAPASGSFEVKLTTKKISSVDNTTLCESGECTKTVNVTVPTCPVIAPKTVCAGTQNVEYDAVSGYTNIVWSTSNSQISIASGQGTHKVRFNVAKTAAGPYTITFTARQNGCPVTCEYTLTVDPLPSVVLTPEQPVCRNPPTGKITAVASGGTGPYVFVIRQGAANGPVITPIITNLTTTGLTYNGLAEGTYYITVTDNKGCSSDPSVQILAVTNPLDFTLTLDCSNQVAGNVVVNLTNITGGATAPIGYEYQVNGTAGTWINLILGNPIIFLPVNSGNYTIYLREQGVNTGCDPASKVINTTCCMLAGVCKLTVPAPLTGCDRSGIPAAKTNPTDVFSGVTFCTEARIKVTTTDGGSLCGGGLTRTYTYVLYDDVIDNNIFDTGEPFIAGTCAETYTVTPPPVVINCPANNLTIPACTTNAAAQTLLDNYKAQFSFTGGCNAVPSFSAVVLPNPCTGGTVSLTYTVTSDCDTKTCTKSIIRTVNPSITLNCADNVNITTCKTQTEINDQFEDWLGDFSVTGGCNATGRFDGEPAAPLACGGTTTVTYRVVDPFGCNTQTCTKTFTVTPPALVINCPANNLTIPACTSADAAQTLLNNYKAQFSFTGGCNAVPSFSTVVLPNPCTGGTVSITYTVTSDCDTKTCTKSIIRTVNPSITLNCADNVNITTCKTQTEINDQFEDWLGDFSVTGGCNATGRFDGEPAAPLACGGTTTVTYRVVDPFGCNTQTCTKTFTVTPPALVINCPANNLTIPACTSADAAQTLLNNYKAQFSFTGGCNAVPSFSVVVLPNPCTGGTVSLTYTVTSDCDTKTCTKSIIRTVNPSITLNCADNVNITTCKTQTEINDQFEDWLGDFSVTGGCNATGRFDGEPAAPLACGGTTTVTYRVVDPFGCNTQTCTKTFTVTPPALVINCPEDKLFIPACKTQAEAQALLDAYKTQFSYTGGCNAVATFSTVVFPELCVGGVLSIKYKVISDCDRDSCIREIEIEALRPVSVGDTAFVDNDLDGLQEPADQGLAGVTVTLYNATTNTVVTNNAYGFPLYPLVTDANGAYLFDSLAPGSYYVVFNKNTAVNGANYVPTIQNVNANGNDADDSDANPTTGRTAATPFLNAGEKDLTLDAGFYLPVTVGDTAFVDNDFDGLQEAGDQGLAGVTVTLYNAVTNAVVTTNAYGLPVVPQITNASGAYLFDSLAVGSYYVVFNKNTAVNGANYVPTKEDINANANDADDSDANLVGQTEATGFLSSGQKNLTLDAGFYLPVTVGDTAFVDNDFDGLQEAGDQGLAGVTVTLYNAATNAVVTTNAYGLPVVPQITNASGAYLFDSLAVGSYYVVFNKNTAVNGANYVPTKEDVNANANDADDSDANLVGQTEATGFLSSGQSNLTLDAGFYLPVTVGDTAFVDNDFDGLQEAGDQGLAGVTVTLYNAATNAVVTTNAYGLPVVPQITNASGAYLFDSLAVGSYYVVFNKNTAVNGANYVPTKEDVNANANDADDSDANPAGQTEPTGFLTSGQKNLTLDAGFYLPVTVGDTAFVDNDFDGLQEAGDQGLAGVTVTLYNAATNAVVTTNAYGLPVVPQITNANGAYLFDSLAVGSYYVVFNKNTAVNGANYVPTKEDVNANANDADDSDANLVGQTEATGFLTSGQKNLTLDAGFYLPVTVGDTAFVDNDFDGLQEAGDQGLAGVTVTLYNAATNAVVTTNAYGLPVVPQVTNANGAYLFDSLAIGNYYVVFNKNTAVNGANYVPTKEDVNANANDADDSDANLVGQTEATGFLTSGQKNLTLDAGFYLPVTVGDTAFVDNDFDGLQEPGDQGLAGVTVTLYNAATNAVVTTNAYGLPVVPQVTNANGAYLFDSLAVGSYYVVFNKNTAVNGANYVPTKEDVNANANDADDSDANLTGQTEPTGFLTSGQKNLTLDAGFYLPVTVGDTAFVDNDFDGLQEAGDQGLAGVTVTLYNAATNAVVTTNAYGLPVVPQITDATGKYLFDSLAIGNYYVVFNKNTAVNGTNYVPTKEDVNANANDADDSDANPAGQTEPTGFLSSGQSNLTLDAGFYLPVTVGDTAFVDNDFDGLQEPGDQGLAGVTVTLYNAVTNAVVTTNAYGLPVVPQITDATGKYLFDSLAIGNYYVVFNKNTAVNGANYVPTKEDVNANANDADDSDANPAGQTEATGFLTSGQKNLTLDAGFYLPVTVGDTAFVDNDGNGLQDPTDQGFPGVTVTLYNAINNTVVTTNAYGLPVVPQVTDANGKYLFDSLAVGNYYVVFNKNTAVNGANYVPTKEDVNANANDLDDSDANPAGQTDPTGLLTSGQRNLTLDAGFYLPVVVGDTAFVDNDRDGLQEAGDQGLAGVTVTLFNANGTPVTLDATGMPYTNTTSTGNNGSYLFTNLPPGSYYVVFDKSTAINGANYAPTIQNVNSNGNDADDSDANLTTGRTAATPFLTSGQRDLTLDAGFYLPVTVGDTAFVDNNFNGLQDPNDQGLAGVTVTLYDALTNTVVTTNAYGLPVVPQVTDANGKYLFDSLAVGNYYVVFNKNTAVNGANYVPTKEDVNANANDADDSDANPTGQTDPTGLLTSGQRNLTLDAGFYLPVSVGDTAFVDKNGNGLQDPTDSGLPGVTVTLYNAVTNTPVTTNAYGLPVVPQVTDANGKYLFDSLAVGSYYVVFNVTTAVNGNLYSSTEPNLGNNDSKDSDADPFTGRTPATPLLTSGQSNTTLDAGYVLCAPISCINVQVKLGNNCEVLITPEMVLVGTTNYPSAAGFTFLVADMNGRPIPGNLVTGQYAGMRLRYSIQRNGCTDILCWGEILVEDGSRPRIARTSFTPNPVYCFDANFILNNPKTIGELGVKPSPRQIPAGTIVSGGNINDEVLNLGIAEFFYCDPTCKVSVKWSDRLEVYDCDSINVTGTWGRIYRSWVATSCNGMIKDTVQVIVLKRPALGAFAFTGKGKKDPAAPAYDWTVTYNTCSPDKALIKKEDWMPRINSTFHMLPDLDRRFFLDQVECNYSVQIKDTEFPICNGKGLKIDREIYVFDWCKGGIVDTFHVLIKIGDFEAPTYTLAHHAPFEISTGPMDCTAAFPVTVAGIKSAFGVEIKDNCNLANASVTVWTKDRYVKGILVAQNTWDQVEYAITNGMMIGVPIGKHRMKIEAFDGCYNASDYTFDFEVKDKIAPVMKCDDQLNVSLSNGNGYTTGYAQVSAKDIDEGSWDNCKLAWIKVRRNVPEACTASFIGKGYDTNGNGKLDPLPADGDWTKADGFDINGDGDLADFGETFVLKGGKLMTPLQDIVEFFCCDLTALVTVELWGSDIYGNTNFCWDELLIEDKVAPTCAAPWDFTIDCDDKNLEKIDSKKASALVFGDVTITSGNDCAALDTVYTTEKNLKCGAGYIDRIWKLTKQTVKGPITITCKQRIYIRAIHEYNICFPKDATSDCKTPIVDSVLTDELSCDILAVNVSDKRYDASDNECYKIFRTYTVINWCVYDDRCGDPMAIGNVYVVNRATFSNYGKAPIYVLVRDENRNLNEEFYLSKDLIPKNADDERFFPALCEASKEYYHSFMYTQIIKVYDNERPVVTGVKDTFCTSPTACTANITKVVSIKDNCTDKVELERQSLMIAPNQTLDASKMITFSTPSWSTKDLGNGKFEIKVSNLPEGTHDLIVVGRDECGNLSLPTRIPFVIKDCKAPAPICINGLSTDLMPDGNGSGMMTVWATDFVASKIYDCNGQGPETKDGLKLVTKYSLNRVGEAKDKNKTSINLTCTDKGKVVLVELHAWDEAGNDDFCVTFIEVQDNRKVCPTSTNVTTGEISGIITTDDTEPVNGVKIEVSGSAQMNQTSSTNGIFNFTQLQLGNDFTIAAQLDKDHLNGVTTFDLVLLQKHILGAQTITNPYRLIAADVNNSKTISTLDLIQIRKLILNIDQRFNNVTSWRFVDAAYKFPDPTNPWAETFPEVVNVNDLAGKVQANFIAIKMGDINSSAIVSNVANSEVRGNKALNLQTEEQAMKTGQRYAVSIRAKDLDKIQGYQFTLQVDPAQAKIENIEYNGTMKAEHFGFFPQTGQITTSFVRSPQTSTAISKTSGDDVLFTLMLKAESNIALSQILKINSRLTPQEAYNVQDELMDVKLMVSDATFSDKAVLYQNKPNPFVDQTAIDFYLPNATSAVLTIHDVKGAMLYKVKGNYSKGNNQVILKQEHLHTSGVLYYTLETADFTATQKMVLLNK